MVSTVVLLKDSVLEYSVALLRMSDVKLKGHHVLPV